MKCVDKHFNAFPIISWYYFIEDMITFLFCWYLFSGERTAAHILPLSQVKLLGIQRPCRVNQTWTTVVLSTPVVHFLVFSNHLLSLIPAAFWRDGALARHTRILHSQTCYIKYGQIISDLSHSAIFPSWQFVYLQTHLVSLFDAIQISKHPPATC